MFIPARRSHHDIAPRFNRCSDIGNDRIGRGEIDANVHVAKPFRSDAIVYFENACNGFALVAGDRVNFASHFAEADQCNSHAKSFLTSLSYTAAPSMSSPLATFSSAVCASSMDPG